ncbi:MAG TPA: EamA family transporter [Thermoplasmata archaeon]|nr:EamA family transporter [Thermoplasmata archaeon]
MAPSAAPSPGRFGATEVGLLAVTSLVWGAAYVFIREGIVYGASPLAFASARYLLSAVAFSLLAAARREAWPTRRAFLISATVGGVLIIGLYGGFLYWGEQYTTGGYAAVLASTAPLLTVTAGFFLLQSERLGPRGLLGMAIGFVGAAVLVLPQLTGTNALGSWQGPLFVLGAMVCTAVGTVVLRRVGRGPQGLWQIGTQFTVAGLMLGTAALVIPSQAHLPLTNGVLEMLAILVAFSSVVGYFGYFSLHHRVGPVRANVVAYLAPLVGVAVGTGLYSEPITFWEVSGVAIVLVGVTLVLWESSRRTTSVPAAPSSRA